MRTFTCNDNEINEIVTLFETKKVTGLDYTKNIYANCEIGIVLGKVGNLMFKFQDRDGVAMFFNLFINGDVYELDCPKGDLSNILVNLIIECRQKYDSGLSLKEKIKKYS